MDADAQAMNIGELSDKSFVYKEVTWRIPGKTIRKDFLDYDVPTQHFHSQVPVGKCTCIPMGLRDRTALVILQ